MRLKDFSETIGQFKYRDPKTKMVYMFDNSMHYHPFRLLDAKGREIGCYETLLDLKKALANFN